MPIGRSSPSTERPAHLGNDHADHGESDVQPFADGAVAIDARHQPLGRHVDHQQRYRPGIRTESARTVMNLIPWSIALIAIGQCRAHRVLSCSLQ
jgi:hypothetical protein